MSVLSEVDLWRVKWLNGVSLMMMVMAWLMILSSFLCGADAYEPMGRTRQSGFRMRYRYGRWEDCEIV